jgi:aminoglycoside phosphotransferase family enzyme/predicted kinase
MDLSSLIGALSDPAAYPYPVQAVEVRHTHISVVFLAGPFVYKVKKPVALGFLDFSTLEKRRFFCNEELRLNRRLAEHVYLGVVPITAGGKVEGEGQPAEWAVKMRRLPDDATLHKRLGRGEVDAALIEKLARTVARFHAAAETNAHIASFGRFEVVAGNARENFQQAQPHIAQTLSESVWQRLHTHSERELDRLRLLIEGRAQRGVPRDTHGDLHLDHVYLFPECEPPHDLVIMDCIEFNERFRYADPVADMAFLRMDLLFHGRRDLARAFANAYFAAAQDEEARDLLPFYSAYRAAVRGKVDGFELTEKEIPPEERDRALERARAHWLLALGELAPPGERPCLVLVGGLPGTGKSTLSRGLAEQAGFDVIRSDEVRKELAGVPVTSKGRHIYTPEWSQRTYRECWRRAEQRLFEGRRVIVDATFSRERDRREFLAGARRWAVPAALIVCQADRDVVRQRLARRSGDVSDADWEVYEEAERHWEPLVVEAVVVQVGEGVEKALEVLRPLECR